MSKPILKQPRVFIEIDDEEQEMWNGELNALRESGDMNMFGAVRWLLENFEMSKNGANQIFYNWTRTFESSGEYKDKWGDIPDCVAKGEDGFGY